MTAKNGISSVELGRRLGVRQPTAWTKKQKIMAVMARREGEAPLSGRVEMDHAYLGGVRAGGKRGRGARQDTLRGRGLNQPRGPATKGQADPGQGLPQARDRTRRQRWVDPGTEVVTDGLNCWNALGHAGYSHRAIRTGCGRKAARMAPFKWVNTTLGNIKSAITGTYRKLGPDHAERDLASLRLALQPTLPAPDHDPALPAQRRTHTTHPLSHTHRRLSLMDKQVDICA